jgi:hypothetical protein
MILTRQEKEKWILDLYNMQGKTYTQITEIAMISPTSIKLSEVMIIDEN